MAMQEWEMRQKQKGNVAGATIARALIDLYGDVPLPFAEAPVEIKRFSTEAREGLAKQGLVIRELTGQSIQTLRGAGRKFRSTWHDSSPAFEALTSMHSEVAINPSSLFLPNSKRKPLRQQEAMVEKFSEDLSKTVLGVKAIMGEAPDYTDLAFAHLDATSTQGTPEFLFGEKYGYNYARTKTKTSGSRLTGVGRFAAAYGLDVVSWDAGDGFDDVFDDVLAAPLVVPA